MRASVSHENNVARTGSSDDTTSNFITFLSARGGYSTNLRDPAETVAGGLSYMH
jgi:hypothetical protein